MAEWVMYNPSPAGRSVGDCSIRALTKALNIDWETAYAAAAFMGFQLNDMPSSNAVWGSLLRQHGFRRHIIPDSCPDCYTIGDFADDHPDGLYVVGSGNHVVTVRHGIVFDSWDSRGETALFYWTKGD